MDTQHFVRENSIVREIWGKADNILFIFAGAAAEFSLNKAVDWLYFTGRLPSDPLGRLFSTVSYARKIVFSDRRTAIQAIDAIVHIHASVERKRGAQIPDWAYRDVLFMLIDYTIRSFELLERKCDNAEKIEIFNVFYRVGERMGIDGLPETYMEWVDMRQYHLQNNLLLGKYTLDLYRQYKKHLGPLRYYLMLQTQKLLVPSNVKKMLPFLEPSPLIPLIGIYKLARLLNIHIPLRNSLLPAKFQSEIKSFDQLPSPKFPVPCE